MAIEIKKRGEIINSIDAAASQDLRIAESRERRFADNDRATVESIVEIYDENKARLVKGTDDEQVMLLSTLHSQREFMGWFIGEALQIIETSISDGKKSGYNSLNNWLEVNSDRLGFSKRAAYNYVSIRESTTLDQFKKLGVGRSLAIAQIRDEKKREQAVKIVTEKKMDIAETKQYIDEIFTREKEKARKIVVAKKEEAFEEVKYSVTKASATTILISTDRKYIEALQNVILADEARLKLKVIEEYKRITGR